MKNIHKLLTLSVAVLAFGSSCQHATAQPADFANFDPKQMMQQIQERMIASIREQLGVTDDAEWKIIEPRLTKVVEGRMTTMMGGMRGMMGRPGGGPGGPGGPGGFPGFGQTDPDAEALQKVLDAHAPEDQIKAALAKYCEARKRKADELAKKCDQLREVLSLRQEAILVSMGMLN